MELPFFLWLGYHGVAVTLAVWACVSAIAGRDRHATMHRAWTFCAALLLPPCLLLAALAISLRAPGFWSFAALVPVLTLAAAASNVATLARTGLGTRLLCLPITAWNALLVAVFFVRALADLAGEDAGSFGTALLGGYAALQTVIGRSDALVLPVFLHLPFCLPLATTIGWHHRLAIGAASAWSLACLGLFAVAMPSAHDRASRFRADELATTTTLRPDQVLGVRVAWDAASDGDAARAEQHALWIGLGARALCIDVDAELFEDPPRLQRVTDELAFARDEHRAVIAIARPPRIRRLLPAASLPAFFDEMAKVHWLCAERLAPDWIVLFDDPFGALVRSRVDLGTVADWIAACERGADDVRRANERCQTMVVIGTRAPHAQRLFEALARRDSPLAAIGISLRIEDLAVEDVQRAFATHDEWLGKPNVQRPVWLIGYGASPADVGGELGQWNHLHRAVAFCASHPGIAGLVVDALQDGDSARGLVTVDGRLRLAYRRLREVALGLAAPR